MIFISLSDWILARSQAFRLLLNSFRKHKVNTKNSFDRVKKAHYGYNYLLEGHEARIRELEKTITELKENSITILKKRKT